MSCRSTTRLRRRRLPVRRDVLPRQGAGVRGGAARADAAADVFIFNVWDRIEENEFADVVTTALAPMFPDDPPRFMARTPHGYHDVARIARDLAAGGFAAARDRDVAARSRAASPRIAAIAYCQGTPLRNEIEARDPARLDEATTAPRPRVAARSAPARSTARSRRTSSRRSNSEAPGEVGALR